MSDTDRIPLAEALHYLPKRQGKHLTLDTLKRWVTKGVGGVRLSATKFGGRWYTTVDWIREFEERCTQQRQPTRSERPEGLRREAVERARAYLRSQGFNV
jgi:hypothetical protein